MAKFKRLSPKWLVAIAIVVAAAIVVTCVVVFTPRDVGKAKTKVSGASESMYLNTETSSTYFDNLSTKVKSSYAEKYGDDVDNVESVCQNLVTVMEFYGEIIVFVSDSSAFQSNYSAIMNGLTSAQSYQQSMEDVALEVYQTVGSLSATFINGAWAEFKEYFQGYLESYNSVISALEKVVCADDNIHGVKVNDLTELTLEGINYYLEEIASDFDGATTIISYFGLYLGYLNSSLFEDYAFSDSLQTKTALIKTFDTVYSDNMGSVIASITSASGFSYRASSEDSSGALTALETFLQGGLSA